MKIISQFKDFYDYKVAKYGLDEKLVFDRRNPVVVHEKTLIPEGKLEEDDSDTLALHSVLYIGNNPVHIFGTKNKIYTHFDLVDEKSLDTSYYYYENVYFKFNDGKTLKINTEFIRGKNFLDILKEKRKSNPLSIGEFNYVCHYVKPDDEKISNWDQLSTKPIILIQRFYDENIKVPRKTAQRILREQIYINPPLNKMGLYIDPDWVWQSLVEFLSALKTETEQSPEMANDLKIQSKGFDRKTSFRPKMKK